MALTSYTWRGTQLNDGTSYSVPWSGLALDDSNPSEAAYAYRQQQLPTLTGLTLKEGVFTLTVNLHASSLLQLRQRVDALKKLFNTADPTLYPLYRQFPHEAAASYVECSPTDVSFDMTNRRCIVTFTAPNKAWRSSSETTQTQTLFDAGATETMTITYNGNKPVEPILELTALTAGSTGPVPLYYRTVTLWTVSAARARNYPILLVSGWNTSTLVSGGKIRSDGLDITVTLPDGATVPRLIEGSDTSRRVWIKPNYWPRQPECWVESLTRSNLGTGDTTIYIYWNDAGWTPASTGTIMIDDEQVAYSIQSISRPDSNQPSLAVARTTITRAQNGTTAATHTLGTRVRWPYTLQVNYGYAAAYATIIPNVYQGWPLIDYATSTNQYWYQPVQFVGNGQGRSLLWWSVMDLVRPARSGERITSLFNGDPTTGMQVNFTSWYPATVSPFFNSRLYSGIGDPQGRQLSRVRLTYSLQGGSGALPSITLRGFKSTANFNAPGEVATELFSQTHTTSGSSSYDSGWIDLDTWNNPGTFWLRIDAAPTDTARQLFLLTQVQWEVDMSYGTRFVAGTISGSEYGASAGEYPVFLSVTNLDDPSVPAFSVATRMATNDVVSIDCDTRVVTGAALVDLSYKNAVWLRLQPGTNRLQFTAATGVGQVSARVKWKERY